MDFSHQELFIVVGFMAAAVLGLLLFVSTRMTIARINREMENRRDVERELRISESRLREAMQGTDTGLWEWNPQSGEIYLDTVWFTILTVNWLCPILPMPDFMASTSKHLRNSTISTMFATTIKPGS